MVESRVTAPVHAHAATDIAAPVRQVWSVVADIAAWPTWNPAVREAVFEGELERGARFRYATPLGSIRCRIATVDAPRRLAWSGRLLAMRHEQAYLVEATDDGARVEAEASLSGIGARLFRRRLGERLQAELEALVRLLKLEAEVRSQSAVDAAAGDGGS